MLLKILLLQVMSIGLITVRIKAQEPTLAEIPELYMADSDKALLNSIWNLAGFPSDQADQKPEVTRKFLGFLGSVAPGVIRSAIPQLAKIPGFPKQIKPVLPVLQALVPKKFGRKKHSINNNRQHTLTDSPTSINYKILPKPSNLELDSAQENESPRIINNRRTLHLGNANLEITDDNDKETNAEYYPTENLKTSPQDLETTDLAMEQMKRMMQFQGVDDNIHINKKSGSFLQRKTLQNMNGGPQSQDTTTNVNIPSRSRKNHGYNPMMQ